MTGRQPTMPAKFKTLQEEWEGFAASVIHPNAPKAQRDEMRMAFFSGAWVLVNQTIRIGDDDVSEQEGIDQIARVRAEIEEFKREYIRHYSEKN